MSEKNMDKMKAFIEAKKKKQKDHEKSRPSLKIGSSRVGNNSMKSGGSNNKV